MPASQKHAVAPAEEQGFRLFVSYAYPNRYNFAVDNYNEASNRQKRRMFGGFLVLYRSVVSVLWIISSTLGVLALISGKFVIGTVLISVLYLGISFYNLYVFIDNRSLVNGTRLLLAKTAGPTGADHEWVSVPLDSRSASERLSAVDQTVLDSVRREYAGQGQQAIDCLVYTRRYADSYPSFPKEILLHIIVFLVSMTVGIAAAAV